jgi:hypothetical protein
MVDVIEKHLSIWQRGQEIPETHLHSPFLEYFDMAAFAADRWAKRSAMENGAG